MSDLLPVIVGGVIGVAGGLVGPLLLDSRRRKREQRSLTRAIASEIRSIIEIVRVRGYIEGLRELIENGRALHDQSTLLLFGFSVSFNPFAVYDANLDKLGLLEGDLADLVPQFYLQARSVLEDIRGMNEEKSTAYDLNSSIEHLQELLRLFEATLELGQRIVKSAA